MRFATILLTGALCATPLIADPIDRDGTQSNQGSDSTVTMVNDGADVPNLIAPVMVTATITPEEWLASDMAVDFNEDGVIDTADYRIWASTAPPDIAPMPFEEPSAEEWLASDWAADLNKDGIIDKGDYKVWREPVIEPMPIDLPTADGWIDSDLAVDLDENGVIDTDDYRAWAAIASLIEPAIAPEENASTLSYEDWYQLYPVDLNEDGAVDEADYEEWQAQPFLIAPTAVQNESWGNIKNSLTR